MTMQLDTHQEAVDLVKEIFKSMGGRVIPPKRLGSRDKYSIMTPERYSFMMDFENACLSQNWDSGIKPHPKGNKRYEDPEWAAMVESNVYPHHSDVDWHEYVDWVSRGFGDEWFQEDDPPDDTRCMGCGRGDDFCRCGQNSIWFGDDNLWTVQPL